MLKGRIQTFLKQATRFSKAQNNPAETITVRAVIITPKGQFQTLGVTGLGINADFTVGHCEDVRIIVRLQPGVYFDKILPYRDDLKMQVISSTQDDVILREYVATPLFDSDPRSQNNDSKSLNMGGMDQTTLCSYEFQLMDKIYDKIKLIECPKTLLMTNAEKAIINIVDKYTSEAPLELDEVYKGLYFVRPIDNTNMFKQVVVPEGITLKDFPLFMQNAEEYGVYSRGLGSFFKQGYWWIYPLFNFNRVEGYSNPIDIVRVPKDKIPTLDSTFYKSDNGMTIIVTGESTHEDSADIRKQNKGVGQRLIMSDAIEGETGMHYVKGRAITTRADSVQEFKLSERRNGKDYTPLSRTPTSNVCKSLSMAAMNEGEFMQVGWDHGDVGYLEPGHPIRFQYLGEDDMMVVRKGVLLGYTCKYVTMNAGLHMKMKRMVTLNLFLKRQEKYKAEKE